MNSIPDDDEMKWLDNLNWWLKKRPVGFRTCGCTNNPCTCYESELERLDRKYAPLFEKLEKG